LVEIEEITRTFYIDLSQVSEPVFTLPEYSYLSEWNLLRTRIHGR